MRGWAFSGGSIDGHGWQMSSSMVGARTGGNSGDNVSAGDVPRNKPLECDCVWAPGGLNSCGHGGTQMAIFNAMLPPAEKPEMARRDESSLILSMPSNPVAGFFFFLLSWSVMLKYRWISVLSTLLALLTSSVSRMALRTSSASWIAAGN